MRRYLTGVVVLVALATCAVASDGPAALDVKKLKPAEKTPSEAVGGGEVGEGFVTSYGAFRLSKGKQEGLIMARNDSEPRGFFNEVKLVYIGEHRDAGSGAAGSLYRTSFADGQERYYFFGNEDVPCDAPARLRLVIAFDGGGRVLHAVPASYARMLKNEK